MKITLIIIIIFSFIFIFSDNTPVYGITANGDMVKIGSVTNKSFGGLIALFIIVGCGSILFGIASQQNNEHPTITRVYRKPKQIITKTLNSQRVCINMGSDGNRTYYKKTNID